MTSYTGAMKAKELFDKAQKLRNNAQFAQADQTYQEAAESALGENDLTLRAEAEHQRGTNAYQNKDFTRAFEHLRIVQGLFQNQGNKLLEGATLRDMGMAYREMGDYISAKEMLQQSITSLEDTHNMGHLGISKVELGTVFLAEGDLEEAARWMKEGIEDTERSPDSFFTSTGYFDLAHVYLKQGKIDDARVAAHKAQEILEEVSKSDEFQPRRQEIQNFLGNLEI